MHALALVTGTVVSLCILVVSVRWLADQLAREAHPDDVDDDEPLPTLWG